VKKLFLLALLTLALTGCRRNQAPGTPAAPDGAASVLVDSLSTYTAKAADADGDRVSYRFSWGDGDTSGWVEPTGQTLPGGASHTWHSSGTFVVRAQARDIHEDVSLWSDGLSVSVVFSWQQAFGGADFENAAAVQQTADGGYIIAGTTNSFGAGMNDAWLVKTNERGEKEWDKTYGGAAEDACRAARQTSDSGYILAGYTYSEGAGRTDFWLVKTDAAGNTVWDRTFGDSGAQYANAVRQTTDGGYIVVGSTNPFGVPDKDLLLVRTDASGNLLWHTTLGGEYDDEAAAVLEAADGGYIVAGMTNAVGVGMSDAWLIKIDASGNKVWDKTFGGTDEGAEAVEQAPDGGYIVAGTTYSDGAGSGDVWLIKTDAGGDLMWSKTFGGADEDLGKSVAPIADGGYVVAGYTYSFGAGSSDVWLVKTDGAGNEVWSRTYGGPDDDYAGAAQPTTDGGYVIGANTRSYGAGMADLWLVKTGPNGE
jgi:hypothetical protein